MNRQASPPAESEPANGLRERIILAAAKLIAADGRGAATTRAVAAAANIQAPAIYRIFQDKRGLLDAVAQDGFARYVAEKSIREPHPDPVEDLRLGWDVHVEFGLTHPGLYTILSDDSGTHAPSPAAVAGDQLLRRRINAIARAGRLKVNEDRAVALLYAACVGTVLTLLRQRDGQSNSALSADAREAILAAITTDPAATVNEVAVVAAVSLRASLHESAVLSSGEKHLLGEWLDRIIDA